MQRSIDFDIISSTLLSAVETEHLPHKYHIDRVKRNRKNISTQSDSRKEESEKRKTNNKLKHVRSNTFHWRKKEHTHIGSLFSLKRIALNRLSLSHQGRFISSKLRRFLSLSYFHCRKKFHIF